MVYFSNSSDGAALDSQCGRCILGKEPCPVALIQGLFNYDQCDIPKLKEAMEILVNSKTGCEILRLLKPPQMPTEDEKRNASKWLLCSGHACKCDCASCQRASAVLERSKQPIIPNMEPKRNLSGRMGHTDAKV